MRQLKTIENKGDLTFIKRTKVSEKGAHFALYKCVCGNEKEINISNVNTGKVRSCGCYNLKQHFIHGLSKHPLMKGVWSGMIQRCTNPNEKHFANYGGRGIVVCDEWKNNFYSFYQWAINNGWQKGLHLDRILNDGNYEPVNCRFVTHKANQSNTRKNAWITYNGMNKTKAQWSEHFGISYNDFNNHFIKGGIENVINWLQHEAA